jgi:signal transduction histidine kinase
MPSMGSVDPLPGLLCAALLPAFGWWRERGRRLALERTWLITGQSRESLVRLLRLAAADQRDIALGLMAHAQAEGAAPALAGLAHRLLELSDNLLGETVSPDEPRHLKDEVLVLMPVVEFAMAQVAAQLGPGRRAWRIDPAFETARLLADRRALNQVLVHVLAGAASATRDGDWIDLSLQEDRDGVSIVVQDEGVGLALARHRPHAEESRGIGLRLTLARSLMHAHGGSLSVQSAERVGTRVRLCFPPERIGR